jgi:hypothetical protein
MIDRLPDGANRAIGCATLVALLLYLGWVWRGGRRLGNGAMRLTLPDGRSTLLQISVGAADLEAPRGIRVNAVSPPWVTETLQALKMDSSQGLSAAVVARSYVQSVTGTGTGLTPEPSPRSLRRFRASSGSFA